MIMKTVVLCDVSIRPNLGLKVDYVMSGDTALMACGVSFKQNFLLLQSKITSTRDIAQNNGFHYHKLLLC